MCVADHGDTVSLQANSCVLGSSSKNFRFPMPAEIRNGQSDLLHIVFVLEFTELYDGFPVDPVVYQMGRDPFQAP